MAQQKYSIIEKIDAGGMAEVFKGKATSMRGFEKLVAIKRVLPALAKNEKFIAMFLDEARLSLYLNHANIVQTFDIGTAEGASYFVVMEWVDGINLKAIMEVVRDRGFRLPREQAAFIIAEVCKGLNHAHNRKDPNGVPLNIVHRDISPPNVMMSREGEVKLVDFGLAKAVSQVAITDPGIVKGKFSYLSPEAAYGKPVDARADIFSAGVVLWEMLAGRRLFDGPTDLKTVELVRATRIPPLRTFNPDIEPQLEAIVRKALARNPRGRFQTAEAMGHELSRFLFDNRLLVTSYDIALLAKRAMQTRNSGSHAEQSSSGAARLQEVVQAEIGAFVSVQDLERTAFKAVAEEADEDRTIIVNAEDPRGWAGELGMDEDDEATVVSMPPLPVFMPPLPRPTPSQVQFPPEQISPAPAQEPPVEEAANKSQAVPQQLVETSATLETVRLSNRPWVAEALVVLAIVGVVVWYFVTQ